MVSSPINSNIIQSALTDTRLARLLTVAKNRQRGLRVLMENLENPFNVQAIARTCDAMGIQDIGFVADAAFDPHTEGENAARSASKWLTYQHYETDVVSTLQSLKSENWHVLATVADDQAIVLHEADLTHEKLVVLVGNERKGISPTALALADSRIVIPMSGMVQSLNVSVATALVLYEIVAQRRRKGDFLYHEDEAVELAQRWIAISAEPHKRKPKKDA